MFPAGSSAVIPEEPFDGDFSPYAQSVLSCALDIGANILSSGGEISRVEDTVTRICRAFGAKTVRVFAITSMVQASMAMENGTTAFAMRRIGSISTNLYRLQCFNDLSRRLCSGAISLEAAPAAIARARVMRPYPNWLIFFGSALAAGGFAVFFGGTVRDGIAAAIVGLVMSLLDCFNLPQINRMAHTGINAFLGGVCSILLCAAGLGQNIDEVLIGTIMILIPGLAFGNALRDLLGNNLISGALRMLECILLAAMIAFGYMAALMLFGGLLP